MRLFLAASVIFFTFISTSYAGFEWVPPKNMPAPTMPAQRAVMAPPPVGAPAPLAVPASPRGMTAPILPVMRAPVAPPTPPAASMPAPSKMPMNVRPQYSPQRQPQSASKFAPQMPKANVAGLYINPYPLRNPSPEKMYRQMSAASIDQAMMEKAGVMNPVQLGNGMASSAKISPVASSGSNFMRRPVPAPLAPSNMRSSSLTPMQGGEPAPLNRSVSNSYAEAVGFGRDLPLALALSQIIPNDYSHRFANDANAGAIVSWEGGKPWNQALNDMLSAKGMTATIQGKQVIIQ
jgi:hypothetical protein